jgi:hemolysin D
METTGVAMKDNHEFKPILAEIEENPVPPFRRLVLWSILLFIIIVILGLYLFKVDVVVSARGKIIPDGDIKILNSLDTGVIKKINVKEGDFVKAGDILIEIDPTVESTNTKVKEELLKFYNLTKQRVDSLIRGKEFTTSNSVKDSNIQSSLYETQKKYYSESLKEKQKEIEILQNEIDSIKEDINKLNKILSMAVEEESRYKSLSEAGAIPENRYLEKSAERIRVERELDQKKSQLEEDLKKVEALKHQIEVLKSEFHEKLLSDVYDAYQKEKSIIAELTASKFIESKKYIKSPVNGYVHLIAVKTIGGVVTAGEPLISIVPENTRLLAKVIVLNQDIGFVKKNQDCIIKIDAYDFQKYGTIKGKVETINPFSIEDKEIGIDGYPVYINLLSTELRTKEGEIYKVKPGMTVLTEINIGRRRVIELLLSPIIKNIDEGIKVR